MPVIIVDRGSCTFVTKVRNVQRLGGKAAIIINNQEDDNLIFALNDDGTAKDITIPGILVSKKDGEILKKYLTENQTADVIINIDNQFATLFDTVDLKIDFLPNEKKVYKLLSKLKNNKDFMDGKKINFIPNYVTKNARSFKTFAHQVYSNCFCYGKYCAYPDTTLEATAKDLLTESVRQKCIYNEYYNGEKTRNIYFDYMSSFYTNCVLKKQITENCSRGILRDMNPELNLKIEACFVNSFERDPNDTKNFWELSCLKNTVLENDSAALDIKLKTALPIIYVNSSPFYVFYYINL